MANTKTTIELNGTLYDATTGTAVSQTNPTSVVQPKKIPVAHSGANMDGFFQGPSTVKTTAKLAVAKVVVPATKTRQPEKSRTLMRHAVQKPVLSTSATDTEPKSEAALPAVAVSQRHNRAKQTPKSSSISRFNIHAPKVDKHVAHMPVQAPPVQTNHQEASQAATKAAEESSSSISFTAALQKSNTHQSVKLSKPKIRERTARKLGTSTRLVTVSSVSLAVVLLVGFVAYRNVPKFAMHTAAARAGFSASLPKYTPSGFGLDGAIQAAPGQVTVNFHSNSDDRSYQISQKPSNWTSESLLTNHVAVNNQPYQTYEDKGKTIYIYNDSSATWVSGGVWYQVKGDSSLDTDQLLHIANSF